MIKNIKYGAVIMSLLNQGMNANTQIAKALSEAPDAVHQYKEMALTHNGHVTDLYNSLSPEERIFAYYLFRAALPGNKIATDQKHRHGLAITEMFEELLANKEKLDEGFAKDIETYMVYLWTNHGQYFEREMSEEKRTPERLELQNLTKENLSSALKTINSKYFERIEELAPFIFDLSVETSSSVPGSIEKSSCNIYSPDFTTEHYNKLFSHQRNKINTYFFVDENGNPKTETYYANGKYGAELSESVKWIREAHKYAQSNPKYFDAHLIKSLEYLIEFIETGDEEIFKKHSIEWLKSNSRIDYCFGFIETYMDPMHLRGTFQAEVTIKSMDIKVLNDILPSIEKQLPIPKEFMRDNLEIGGASTPNASINTILFGSGDLGPTQIVAAYCLPNYAEIRSTHGSKQIIYTSTKSIGAKLNPAMYKKLFHAPEFAARLDVIDPEMTFDNEMWNLQCILHETLGHGSGKLATHTFKEGDNLTIDGKIYKVGDTIAVTSENVSELIGGEYAAAIEELRAEINALYVSVFHLDTLSEKGFMKKWLDKMSGHELQEWLILHMARTGLRRYIQQNDNAKEVAGAHALANCSIMNYMVEKGGIGFIRVPVSYESKNYTVVDLKIKDHEKAMAIVKELLILTQRIKSTGDGMLAKHLIETYGRKLNMDDFKNLKVNQKAVAGDLKATANIFPNFFPVTNDGGEIVDVQAEWPKDIFEQYEYYGKLNS